MDSRIQLDALDVVSIMSFLLGYENLLENRQKTAHNDISAANDKQAQYLLQESGRKFDEQNEMLIQILEVLKSDKPTRKE